MATLRCERVRSMKYQVAYAGNQTDLSTRVNQLLAEGWSLQGGVSVTSLSYHNARDDFWETTWEYNQAMCLPESET